jgi:hypothetical protein
MLLHVMKLHQMYVSDRLLTFCLLFHFVSESLAVPVDMTDDPLPVPSSPLVSQQAVDFDRSARGSPTPDFVANDDKEREMNEQEKQAPARSKVQQVSIQRR